MCKLPLREALVFDLNSLPQNSIIEFTLENESGNYIIWPSG
jgi:hypothetical protein